jgi:hypothetical protein
MGAISRAYNSGKPEAKRPLVKPRRRWENDIRMDLTEVGWKRLDWIHLAQERDQWRALVNRVKNFVFHKGWGIFCAGDLLLSSRGGFCSMELVC